MKLSYARLCLFAISRVPIINEPGLKRINCRAERDPQTGKTVVIENMNYGEWKAKHVDNPRGSGIIDLREKVQMVEAKLFEKIDRADKYSLEYREKLKETYRYFQGHGFTLTEHALNRTCGQKSGPGKMVFTDEQLLNVLNQPCNYRQGTDRNVRFYNDIAVVSAEDTDEIISVVVRNKARKDWVVV